ncbi:polysaccharide biosynthesis C-terminal domain-containing protein [Thermoflexus sp.]|uniref:oligosaccharide flippase family protein n=1 Tax=Thermoflexus sp. TaxID=1969742 RepID=UPI0035E454FC
MMSLRARIESIARLQPSGHIDARWWERLAVQSALWGMALFWSRVLGFFQTLLLAHWLGPADFGRFSALQSWLRFGHESGDTGLSMLMVRDLVRQDSPRARTYLFLRGAWIGGLWGLAALATWGAVAPPAIRRELPLVTPLLWVMLGISWEGARLAAAGRLDRAATVVFLTRTVGLTGMTMAARWGWTALWIGFAVAMALDGFGLWMAARRMRTAPGSRRERMWTPEAVGEGVRMLAFGLLGALYTRADSLLLLSLRGSAEAGFYSLAYRFYETGLLVNSAATVALLPRLAREEMPAYRARRILGGYLVLAAGMALGVSLLADPLIRLPFGARYLPAIPMLRWLAWSWIPAFLSGLGATVWISQGQSGRLLLTFALGATMNLVLNLVLIPRWGGVGAAIAMLISTAGMALRFLTALRIR